MIASRGLPYLAVATVLLGALATARTAPPLVWALWAIVGVTMAGASWPRASRPGPMPAWPGAGRDPGPIGGPSAGAGVGRGSIGGPIVGAGVGRGSIGGHGNRAAAVVLQLDEDVRELVARADEWPAG